MERIDLLGVRIDKVDMQTALGLIEGYMESGMPHLVVTADASAVVIAQKDEEFRNIVNNADMVTPDSTGIIAASRWYHNPLIEKVSGVDLAVQLAKLGAEKGYSIFLLGAAPGIADEAAEKLKERFPGLSIAGTHHGFFQDDEQIVELIANSGARMLFVAMGIPKQEKWIAKHLDRLGVNVAMGVGGTLDVLSGRVKRAPEWMRKHGLEWAHRLACNPRKISKVATLPKFLWLVLLDKVFKRS
ncbi:MAG TPA: WecB/TagA/CpsF family glycosyltransferase [Armatimonadota bacterium]|jgi:N-acetylglucosaminyldiphosphoundecaprenol N-acetyl-beta-D-mannosaminyltransferase|nr:WecB/TagA/CpsF family glycosyltransferase [Armatimonadota bacterium]HPP75709.1 WecB/TagA/CpsF family glycosyltransferase [Armatimonadota bacterium]